MSRHLVRVAAAALATVMSLGTAGAARADQLPADQLPADQLPADQLPADQLPADQLPADQLGAGPAGFQQPGPGGPGFWGDRAPVDPVAGYRWPLAGRPAVTRGFDPPARRWLSGHRGVDLAGEPGAQVFASGSGMVAFAGQVAGTGVVSVDHPGGLRTTYQPVEPSVAAGDLVRTGDPLGRLVAAHPGCPVSACLHWGLRQGEFYLDPLSLLGLGQVRLLPRPAAMPG